MNLYDRYDNWMRKAHDPTRAFFKRWWWAFAAGLVVVLLIWVGYKKRLREAELRAELKKIEAEREAAIKLAESEQDQQKAATQKKRAEELELRAKDIERKANRERERWEAHKASIEDAHRWKELDHEYKNLGGHVRDDSSSGD